MILNLILVNVYGINDNKIIIDEAKHQLVALEALSYQWYYNGKKIDAFNKELKIMLPGNYKVVMTNAEGKLTSASINVGMNDDGEVYTIYIIGDSTVSYYSSSYYPLTGWGQVIQHFFNSDVIIQNMAIGGRSAKSFYNDHWEPIRDSLKPGDYVFIQFGINDAKVDDPDRYSEPFTGFKEYLTNFVNETQDKGAHPVLVATVRRNAWNATNPPTVYDAYHDYPVATRQLADTLDVPLVDLDQMSVPLMEGLGPDYTGPFMYMNLEPGEYPNYPEGRTDDVHFQEMGAIEMARLVIESIEGYSDDTIMNKLIPHIKPQHEVSVSTNFPDGAIITRTANYPEGVQVTLKAKIDPAYDLLEWQDGSGNTVGTEDRYQFIMGNEALSFQAVLDDDPVADCNNDWNGTAYIDDCGDCVEGNTGLFPCYVDVLNDTVKIVRVGSGLCIQEDHSGDDVSINQEACLSDQYQSWIFEKDGNNYKIKNIASEMYLYVENIGTNVFLSVNNAAMVWRLEEAGIDTFQIIPADSTEFIIETFGYPNEEGNRVRLWTRTENQNQKFRIVTNNPEDCILNPDICGTGLDDNIETNKLTIAPNPFQTSSQLAVTTDIEYQFLFVLYDIQGKEVFRKRSSSKQIIEFGNNLKKGIYIAKIITGSDITTMRVVKN